MVRRVTFSVQWKHTHTHTRTNTDALAYHSSMSGSVTCMSRGHISNGGHDPGSPLLPRQIMFFSNHPGYVDQSQTTLWLPLLPYSVWVQL